MLAQIIEEEEQDYSIQSNPERTDSKRILSEKSERPSTPQAAHNNIKVQKSSSFKSNYYNDHEKSQQLEIQNSKDLFQKSLQFTEGSVQSAELEQQSQDFYSRKSSQFSAMQSIRNNQPYIQQTYQIVERSAKDFDGLLDLKSGKGKSKSSQVLKSQLKFGIGNETQAGFWEKMGVMSSKKKQHLMTMAQMQLEEIDVQFKKNKEEQAKMYAEYQALLQNELTVQEYKNNLQIEIESILLNIQNELAREAREEKRIQQQQERQNMLLEDSISQFIETY